MGFALGAKNAREDGKKVYGIGDTPQRKSKVKRVPATLKDRWRSLSRFSYLVPSVLFFAPTNPHLQSKIRVQCFATSEKRTLLRVSRVGFRNWVWERAGELALVGFRLRVWSVSVPVWRHLGNALVCFHGCG